MKSCGSEILQSLKFHFRPVNLYRQKSTWSYRVLTCVSLVLKFTHMWIYLLDLNTTARQAQYQLVVGHFQISLFYNLRYIQYIIFLVLFLLDLYCFEQQPESEVGTWGRSSTSRGWKRNAHVSLGCRPVRGATLGLLELWRSRLGSGRSCCLRLG